MTDFTTLTVYLGSSGHARDVFKNAAVALGQEIGRRNKKLVYGGMDAGLMGILANEALAAGAYVTGVVPKTLKDSERIHPSLSQTILVNTLWERKRKMFKRAQAIVSLPGGFGTLDESLEVLYWGALGLHNKPLALLNVEDYWNTIIEFISTLPDFDPKYLIVADTLDDLFAQLEQWQYPEEKEDDETGLPHFEEEILESTHEPLIFKDATVKSAYFLITAIGLKQLGRHDRPIGILNDKGQWDGLTVWFELAEKEAFITSKCRQLMDIETSEAALQARLAAQKPVHIDLHNEKWGPSETRTHIEIKEKK